MTMHEPICETLGCPNDATMFDVNALAFFCPDCEPTGVPSSPEQTTPEPSDVALPRVEDRSVKG